MTKTPASPASNIEKVRIVLCGAYSGTGHQLLRQLAKDLRSVSLPVYVCSDLFPTKDPLNPDSNRQASRACLVSAAGVIFVFLSPQSLGLQRGEADITGGVGLEVGLLYEMRERGDTIPVAFLFDGKAHRSYISTMLQGHWSKYSFEALVNKPGDCEEIRSLLIQLGNSLLDSTPQNVK
jgi:hypothetical protein